MARSGGTVLQVAGRLAWKLTGNLEGGCYRGGNVGFVFVVSLVLRYVVVIVAGVVANYWQRAFWGGGAVKLFSMHGVMCS